MKWEVVGDEVGGISKDPGSCGGREFGLYLTGEAMEGGRGGA